jgi:hypothetical protein
VDDLDPPTADPKALDRLAHAAGNADGCRCIASQASRSQESPWEVPLGAVFDMNDKWDPGA